MRIISRSLKCVCAFLDVYVRRHTHTQTHSQIMLSSHTHTHTAVLQPYPSSDLVASVLHSHEHKQEGKQKQEEGRAEGGSKYTCQLLGNKQTHTSPSITENGRSGAKGQRRLCV